VDLLYKLFLVDKILTDSASRGPYAAAEQAKRKGKIKQAENVCGIAVSRASVVKSNTRRLRRYFVGC